MNSSAKKYRLLFFGVLITLVILILLIVPFSPGESELSLVKRAQKQSSKQLVQFGQMILNYKLSHGGASPLQVSDLFSNDVVEYERSIHRSPDAFVSNPIFSFSLPSNQKSHVLIFEKPGLWSDGSIGVCFDDLTVKRLSPAEFAALGN